jgi:hypothetical protein
LVESWQPGAAPGAGGGTVRTLHVYTNAAYAKVLVNGSPFLFLMLFERPSFAEFQTF